MVSVKGTVIMCHIRGLRGPAKKKPTTTTAYLHIHPLKCSVVYCKAHFIKVHLIWSLLLSWGFGLINSMVQEDVTYVFPWITVEFTCSTHTYKYTEWIICEYASLWQQRLQYFCYKSPKRKKKKILFSQGLKCWMSRYFIFTNLFVMQRMRRFLTKMKCTDGCCIFSV